MSAPDAEKRYLVRVTFSTLPNVKGFPYLDTYVTALDADEAFETAREKFCETAADLFDSLGYSVVRAETP